jgi:hypothetical protein
LQSAPKRNAIQKKVETSHHNKTGRIPKSHTSRKVKISVKMEDQTLNPQSPSGQTVIINQTDKKSNGVGTAGFVLALIAIFLGWIPVLGWILWLLGLILSFVGIFKEPKGLAIAGLVISLIGIILLVTVFGALLGGAAFM